VLCIIAENGDLYTFGETEDGKLGLGHDPDEHTTPQKVHGILGKVVHVACGGKHTVVVTGKCSVLIRQDNLFFNLISNERQNNI
jgi:X-linked retinitis pigmentosa GTPase regulator